MFEFSPYIKNGTHFGDYFEDDGAFYFFGNKNLSRDNLAQVFPQFQFSHLKQVHGTACVRAPHQQSQPEADAQWTERAGLALVVQTADCLPVLVQSPRSIVAIHAGWKGVASNIIGKSLALLGEVEKSALRIAIGPHIQFDDFEIKADTLQALKESWQKSGGILPEPWAPHPNAESYKFNLLQVALAQVRQVAPLHAELTYTHQVSTYASPLHHSYRQSKSTGRQYSFIALTR